MRARCQGQRRNEAERARRGTCGRAEAWAKEVTGIPLGLLPGTPVDWQQDY